MAVPARLQGQGLKHPVRVPMTALADLPKWPGFPPHRYLIDSDGDYQGDPDGPHMCASQANALITALRARLELAVDMLADLRAHKEVRLVDLDARRVHG